MKTQGASDAMQMAHYKLTIIIIIIIIIINADFYSLWIKFTISKNYVSSPILLKGWTLKLVTLYRITILRIDVLFVWRLSFLLGNFIIEYELKGYDND